MFHLPATSMLLQTLISNIHTHEVRLPFAFPTKVTSVDWEAGDPEQLLVWPSVCDLSQPSPAMVTPAERQETGYVRPQTSASHPHPAPAASVTQWYMLSGTPARGHTLTT
jgi:hypothetical protein